MTDQKMWTPEVGMDPQSSVKAAKAYAKAAKAYAKGVRPWYKKKRYILSLGMLVIAMLSVVATALGGGGAGTTTATSDSTSTSNTAGTVTHSGTSNHPAAADVKIAKCGVDPTTGWLDAKVAVLNHSSKTSNYLITVTFDSNGGSRQLDTGTAMVDNLEPNQTAIDDAGTLTKAKPDTFVCKIASVDRMAS